MNSLKVNLPLAVHHLVQAAKDNGGHDNVSAILVRLRARKWRPPTRNAAGSLACLPGSGRGGGLKRKWPSSYSAPAAPSCSSISWNDVRLGKSAGGH